MTRTIQEIEKMIEMARTHYDNGGVGAAMAYYRIILRECSPPKSGKERIALGDACVFFARKALYEKNLGEASDWYWRALEADPRAVDYRIEFARMCLLPMDLPKLALIQAQIAVKLEPENKNAWRILGIVHHQMGNVEKSYDAHRREIECAPDDPYAKLDLATIALDVADYDTVTKMSNAALKTEARGDALHLLAMVAYREGRHEDAIILYDRAISNGVNDPKMAEWNKSLALQSIGRYREGWAASESRFTQTTDPTMAKLEKRFQRPVWKGETNPMRVHLHHEMGFGDVIAMCRYIPLMHEMGHTLSIEVNDSLISLLKRSFPYVHVLPKALDYPGALGLPDFDMHVPMLSLPAIFKTDVDTVPWSGPYLKPPAHVVARDVRRPLVGLCWSSGIRHESLWLKEYGTRKSMSFETLWKGIGRCDATFVTLQIDQEVPSFVNLGDRLDAPSVLDLFKDDPTWDDTAAIVQNLDLVITVDTSIAHLAGALGKPTWVMMHTEGSWHWMTKRLDSPWYPTARLFRQDRPHQWNGVVAQVASELSELSKQKAA